MPISAADGGQISKADMFSNPPLMDEWLPSPEADFDALCRTAAALFSVPTAFISFDGESARSHAGVHGVEGGEGFEPIGTVYTDAVGSDEIFVLEDAHRDPRFADTPYGLGGTWMRFHARAPILLAPGVRVGTLNLFAKEPRPFTVEHRRQLQDLASVVATQVRLHRSERLACERENLLHERERLRSKETQGLKTAEAWSKVGHWRIAFADEQITWSDGMYAVFGRDLQLGPPMKEAVLDVFHPDDREEVRVRLERTAQGHGDYEHQPRLIRDDGEVRTVLARAFLERNSEGESVGLFGMCMDVTDLVRSEERLREASELLRLTLESMSQGLVALGPDQEVRAFNRVAADLLDLPAGVLHEGASFADIRAHQRDRGDFAEVPPRLRSAMAGTDLSRLPSIYDWPLPSGIIVEVRRSRLPEGGVVTTFADVTQQRLAERGVLESEHRFRLLAENATDIIVWSDLTTRRHYVSPAVTAVLGYAPEDLIGTRPLDYVHPDDATSYAQVLDDLTSGRVERVLTAQRYQHRDGRWVWLEISFKLTRDPSTGLADGYVATLRDISERRAMEDALRASDARYRVLAEGKLRDAEARAEVSTVTSAAILAQLAEGVIVTDAMGKITLVNAAAAAIHGVTHLDVAPDAYSDTYHLFTEDGRHYPPLDLPLARAVRGETARDVRWRIRRPDGVEVLAIGSAHPLLGPDGERIGAVLTARDDTARDAAENALRDLNATLSQRVIERTRDAEAARALAEAGSRAKSEFLAAMSHEIRTPLNGVIGYADLLFDEPGLPLAARQHAKRIQSAGSALLTVVNDVLDFSKIEAGQIEIAPRPFAPIALIDNAISIVRGLAEAKGLLLSFAPSTELPAWVVGDQDRLRQVLLNLLNNAVKFTAAGSVTLAVRGEHADGDGVRLRFSVIDTGIGVAADKHDHLFQRFSQVDGSISRDYGGTGLGLAISKALVERMGGTIGVESKEGYGSTFWFEIDVPIAAEEICEITPSLATSMRARRRLLLAEDVPLNQDLARAILERAGHRVDVVGDGASAVTAVQANAYDLILMDVQMPVLDGIAATRQIRALGGTAGHVPILALTANVLPEQVDEFLAAGMAGHVGKPFRQDALLDAIDRWTAPGNTASRFKGYRVDRNAFDALSETIGAIRMDGLLATLAEELDSRFGRNAPAPDRDRLAYDTHAMVSAAAMLGFAELAQSCREVEAACRAGKDYESRLPALRALAAETIAEITVLRAG